MIFLASPLTSGALRQPAICPCARARQFDDEPATWVDARLFQRLTGMMKRLKTRGMQVLAREPMRKQLDFFGPCVTRLADFKRCADVIVANRQTPKLTDVAGEMCARDLFGSGA